jgi:hypothetical protein
VGRKNHERVAEQAAQDVAAAHRIAGVLLLERHPAISMAANERPGSAPPCAPIGADAAARVWNRGT